jgi:hypothetical protein
MLLKTATDLVFISSVGLLLSEFNPENYVKERLKEVFATQTTLLAQLLKKVMQNIQ